MQHFEGSRHLRQHAFVIEAWGEEGIKTALGYAERELGMKTKANPDIIVREFGLFTVDDARRVNEVAMQAPLAGDTKALIIAANRAYHEAQNALLKLFEEPPQGTYLFLVFPTLGSLLPTLRSRVQVLDTNYGYRKSIISKEVQEFLKASREKRSTLIKKLASGADEDERRENRDTALAIVNGIEAIAHQKYGFTKPLISELLRDIQALRGHLHDRSAPVRMILEHLSLVIPKNLL